MRKKVIKRVAKPRGLGDDIARFTHATRLDKLAKKVAKTMGKEDCGCEKRKQKLNNPNLLVNRLFYKK